MSKSISYKHHLRALARFPKDPLRPECQFQDVMRRRLDSRFQPASAAAPAASSETAASHLAANRAPDEKLELEQANALYSLVENRYSRKEKANLFLLRGITVSDYGGLDEAEEQSKSLHESDQGAGGGAEEWLDAKDDEEMEGLLAIQ
ncbi:hypothetical protein LZ554_003825 [Drepanopeziza brunnea f. sp. 'monogermtubi']|nr:hypothetical protein LZ554_003825 [Drepanopeziza brunnea f. sp. 'monogermtubi']